MYFDREQVLELVPESERNSVIYNWKLEHPEREKWIVIGCDLIQAAFLIRELNAIKDTFERNHLAYAVDCTVDDESNELVINLASIGPVIYQHEREFMTCYAFIRYKNDIIYYCGLPVPVIAKAIQKGAKGTERRMS